MANGAVIVTATLTTCGLEMYFPVNFANKCELCLQISDLVIEFLFSGDTCI